MITKTLKYGCWLAASCLSLSVIQAQAQLKAPQTMQAKPMAGKVGPIKTANMPNKGTPLKTTIRRGNTFPEWGKNKVPEKKAFKTFISILNQPKAADVKKVVFIAAGQQQPDPRNLAATAMGYPNVLTGQYRRYRLPCQTRLQCQAKIKPGSMAYRIYKSSRYPLKSTLMVLVFDAQFNHGVSEGNKTKIENAFWDLLTNRFYSGKAKEIALIGQSKGGCLGFSLAKRFRNSSAYGDIPVILQGYDPVCKMKRLGASGTKTYYTNPLKKHPKYKSMRINMDALFPANKRNHLAILNIHSGAAVVDVLKTFSGVHSFTFKPNNIDYGWWKQTWVTHEHTDMGGNMNIAKDTVIPGYKHLLKYDQKFSSYQPPGGGKLGDQVARCPRLFPKKVGSKSSKPICMASLPNKIKTKKCTSRNSPGQIWSAKYCIWQKNSYWHARPLKAKDKAQKCPKQYSRKIDTFQNKPVCKAVLSRKITSKKCSKKGGFKQSSNCLWNNGSYYKARELK